MSSHFGGVLGPCAPFSECATTGPVWVLARPNDHRAAWIELFQRQHPTAEYTGHPGSVGQDFGKPVAGAGVDSGVTPKPQAAPRCARQGHVLRVIVVMPGLVCRGWVGLVGVLDVHRHFQAVQAGQSRATSILSFQHDGDNGPGIVTRTAQRPEPDQLVTPITIHVHRHLEVNPVSAARLAGCHA